jgi:phosphatidylserine decarboxylase
VEVKLLLQHLYRTFIELTNHQGSSKLIRKFTFSKWSRFVIPSYTKVFKVNKEEMDKPLHHYQTLHELFIRRLNPSARPVDQQKDSVVSPVDAKIEAYGVITPQKEMIVKNKPYSIQEMVSNDLILEKYIEGQFIILYLSPKDYHRIHSPLKAQVGNTWTVGQKSYPVNSLGIKYGKEPLVKNFRKLTELTFENGHMLMVKVGAMFINSIEAVSKKEVVEKGEEMAYFTFGSTVILLFEKNSITFASNVYSGSYVKCGEPIAHLKK